MAICIPEEHEINNIAEKEVYNFIKNNFDNNYILYHNYELNGMEFDFLLIDKESYIYIIEVKDWKAIDILFVKNKKEIKYKNNGNNIKYINTNPVDQVRSYKFNFINYIKDKFSLELKVVHLVCLPNINKREFVEKRLDIVSGENITLLKDDFKDKDSFKEKLTIASNQSKHKLNKITNKEVKIVRSIFENLDIKEANINRDEEETYIKIDEVLKVDEAYSIVTYINTFEDTNKDDIYKKLRILWKKGTKIHLVSGNKALIEEFIDYIKNNLGYLSKYNEFEIKEDTESIFNLSTYYYPYDDIDKNFCIIDGEYSNLEFELSLINNYTSFNKKQYDLEHSAVNEHIMVKAGAGSGKTYSMVSRITYLIYKHKYTPEEIEKKLFLITFTNEAADNMKERLKAYFISYYILTQKSEAFKFVESISRMNIFTIHSLCKKIIDKFSSELSLGSSTKIVKGTLEKNKIIEDTIDDFMKEKFPGKDIVDVFNIRTYELRDRISVLLEKLEQKNILIKDNYLFGDDAKHYGYLLQYVMPRVQNRLIKESVENDNVRLSEVIIFIKGLLSKKDAVKNRNINIDYLFVDEFQDTDKMQIEIMKEFQKIIGFKFFVVGDVKQCIYRFRGAEDDAFDQLKGSGEIEFTDHKLVKNYRTDKALLEKFHPIFMRWAEKDNLKYSNEEKLVGVKKLNFSEDDYEKIEYNKESFEDEFIKKLKEEKSRLEKKFKDSSHIPEIAILVRNNYHIDNIKFICTNHDIFIEADATGNLYKLEPIRDFYTLILALKNNKDPKCLFNLFDTCYTTKCEDRSLMYEFKGDKNKLLNYYKELNPIENWNGYIEKLKVEPIMKVIREIVFNVKPWIIYACKYDEADREGRAIYYKRNLELLIENIVKHYNNEYLTVNKLYEALKINIFTGVAADERESLINNKSTVRIICKTIHKSKGLEYDTVILPYCNDNINDGKIKGKVDVVINDKKIGYSILNDDPYNNEKNFDRTANKVFFDERSDERTYKLNEEVRILYVALTRAKSKFIYFKTKEQSKKNEVRWQQLLENDLVGGR